MTLSSSSRPTNPRLALFVIAVVFAIMNADITTVNVALVSLGKDLHADLSDLQWGLNSYMLAFAALIVTAGRLSDVFGRRRCLLAGATVFSVASLLCGIADNFGAGNRTRTTGCRWSAHAPRRHGDYLGRLQRGGACGCARDIGRRSGCGAVDRPAGGRVSHGRGELETGVSGESAVGGAGNDPRGACNSGVARRERFASD